MIIKKLGAKYNFYRFALVNRLGTRTHPEGAPSGFVSVSLLLIYTP